MPKLGCEVLPGPACTSEATRRHVFTVVLTWMGSLLPWVLYLLLGWPSMYDNYACYIHLSTVEPPNKGHFGNGSFVLCSEVVPISEVQLCNPQTCFHDNIWVDNRTWNLMNILVIFRRSKLNSQFIITTFFYFECGRAVIILISNEHITKFKVPVW